MNYIILKCVEDKYSADVTLYDVTDMLPDCFSAREYEHLSLSYGTKYATKCIDTTLRKFIKFIAKPVSDYAGCHILTIQK